MRILHMLRWIIFGFGLICGVIAGNMFFVSEFEQGFAFLAMSAVFLMLSLLAFLRSLTEPLPNYNRIQPKSRVQVQEQDQAQDYDLAADIAARRELAFFVANLAVQCLRDIGRTIPPSVKEIDQVETQVMNLLDRVSVHQTDRAQILDDLDRLKDRTRRAEGGRALIRSTRV